MMSSCKKFPYYRIFLYIIIYLLYCLLIFTYFNTPNAVHDPYHIWDQKEVYVNPAIKSRYTNTSRDIWYITIFRMVYLSDSGWGQRDFEADSETARAVVQKLNYLLDLRQSNARKQRKEYLINKEKKKLKPKSATK